MRELCNERKGDSTACRKMSGPTSAKKKLPKAGQRPQKGAGREKAAKQIAEVPKTSREEAD